VDLYEINRYKNKVLNYNILNYFLTKNQYPAGRNSQLLHQLNLYSIENHTDIDLYVKEHISQLFSMSKKALKLNEKRQFNSINHFLMHI
jgi:hypothetical protein